MDKNHLTDDAAARRFIIGAPALTDASAEIDLSDLAARVGFSPRVIAQAARALEYVPYITTETRAGAIFAKRGESWASIGQPALAASITTYTAAVKGMHHA